MTGHELRAPLGIVGRSLLAFLVLLCLSPDAVAADARPPKPRALEELFTVIGDVPLGPATSRVDYQSIDPSADRLYIAKMGAGTLVAVDLAARRVVAELKGFPKATGVLAVPELHRLYVSVPGAGIGASIATVLGSAGLSSGRGAVAILDTEDLHEIARVPGGVFPDGLAYDPDDKAVFVADELGSAILVIDAAHDRLAARIDAAGGQVGNVRYDPLTRRVYAPIQSHDQLAVIDPATNSIEIFYELPGGRHPRGLALSPDGAIGYVACDGNDQLLSVDLATGAIRNRQTLGHDPDVLALDPALHRLYVAAESGVLASFDITVSAAPVPLGLVLVGAGAHSVAVDLGSHQLELPIASEHGRAMLRILAPK
jgi:DNA-binding beta-propeller fold protein YncE